MAVKEILISHHSHTDIGYTHEQPVLWELHNRYIEDAMDQVEATSHYPEGAGLKWTCEVTSPVLHWLKTTSDANVDRFVKLAREGRIEVAALFCNMTPLYDLEEMYRSLLPVQWLRDAVTTSRRTRGFAWRPTPLCKL